MARVETAIGQESRQAETPHTASGGARTTLPAAAAHQAAGLPERVAALRVGDEPAPLAGEAAALAVRRLARWRDEAGLQDDERFAQRLALDALTAEQFTYLLGAAADPATERDALPQWAAALSAAYAAPRADPPLPLPASAELDAPIEGLLTVAAPLLQRARSRMHEGMRALAQQYGEVPFETDTIEPLLFAGMLRRAFGMLNRTLVLELHVARLEGRLAGDTPAARFASFVEQLSDPAVA